MSTTKNVRQAIDHTLDRWEAAASAMEESVRGTTATVSAQIETQKQMAAAATDKLKDAVETAQHVPAEMRQQIAANLDHLKVQLALGKADASDAAAAQQKEIEDAVKRVESQIDQMGQNVNEEITKALTQWAGTEQQLRHQLELAALRFKHEAESQHTQFQAKQQEMLGHVKEFRDNLQKQQETAVQKSSEFANDMHTAFKQMQEAFRKLGSSEPGK